MRFLVLLAATVLAGCGVPGPGGPAEEELVLVETLSDYVAVNAGEYVVYDIDLADMSHINASIQVPDGPAIDFYVFDEVGWGQYRSAKSGMPEQCRADNSTGIEVDCWVRKGTYWFVLDNTMYGHGHPADLQDRAMVSFHFDISQFQ